MRSIFDRWGLEILAMIGAFFAPIASFILYITLLVIADLITGLLKARKVNAGILQVSDYIKSDKLWKSVSKWLVYVLAIMVAHGAMVTFWPQIEIAKGVLMALTVIEIKSMDENMKVILGYSIFGKFLDLFARSK